MMDPRFGRNHQLHMLLKKRTCMNDHELYEMMRSRNVYRTQHDLRRELDRRLQAIKQDQKIKIASFMVQRATFVKMVAAREKSLRHLLNVKRELGDVFFEEDRMLEDSEDNELDFQIQQEPYIGIYEGDAINDIGHELYRQRRDDQESVIVQTANKEWMESITKGVEGSDRIKIHVDNFDHNRKERILKEQVRKEHHVHLERDSTADSQIVCATHLSDTTKTTTATAKPEDASNRLPEIITTKNEYPKVRLPTNPNNTSSHETLQLLHPNYSKNDVSHKPDMSALFAHASKVPERERTVSMLFVEDSDDDDEDRMNLVSPFDVEAYIERNRQKRGYTIIVASNDLHQSEDGERETINPNPKEVGTGKTTHFKRRIPACTTWGVRTPDRINTRERSKQWYEKFLAARNIRKQRMQTSQNAETVAARRSDNAVAFAKGENRESWNTPSSSDSHISTNLYELKLQRLKQHCQELRDRVAQFVSS